LTVLGERSGLPSLFCIEASACLITEPTILQVAGNRNAGVVPTFDIRSSRLFSIFGAIALFPLVRIASDPLLPDLPVPPRLHPQILALPAAKPLNAPGQVVRTAKNDDGNRPFLHYRFHLSIVPGLHVSQDRTSRRRWA
jgi:hypothetical protein